MSVFCELRLRTRTAHAADEVIRWNRDLWHIGSTTGATANYELYGMYVVAYA